ncbi:MAG: type II secretion system F family protein [Peptoniphilaceae bacterium]|nr:type II secretion system F family protein [Peptoniphilaceae bacterium]
MLYKFIIVILVGVSVYYSIMLLLSGDLFSNMKVNRRIKHLSKMSELDGKSVNGKRKNQNSSIFSFIVVSDNFKKNLMISGIKLKAEEYIVLWVVVTLLPMTLYSFFRGFSFVSIIFAFLGFISVPIWVKINKRKRINKFNFQLNDALLIISNSLRSGFTFRHAIARVAEDLPDPISEELRRVIREINYGANIEDSLKQLAEKMQSKELSMINSAVAIQQRSGGNLAEIIDKVSETISDRIRMKGKISALTAQGRLGGIVIALIPVVIGLAISVINPEYIRIFIDTPIGIAFLIFSIIWELIGFFVISKIVDVKY